jgi:transcriptional regulator with XRE-family HTH domain
MKMIVRKLRLEKGLSQEQLASMAGVSTRTLQRIERGANAAPETLKCLAAVLEVDFSDLRKESHMSDEFPTLSTQEREAMEYVRDIKSFYVHAIQYVIVIAILVLINVWLSPGIWWSAFAAVGWGFGLVVHGLSVFEVFDPFGSEWERRQIARRLRKAR